MMIQPYNKKQHEGDTGEKQKPEDSSDFTDRS
jgi:hypothetical protein